MKQILSRTLFWHFFFNEINPKSYQMLAFSMKQILSLILFQQFQWNKSPALPYLGIHNEMKTKPYLILAFSME